MKRKKKKRKENGLHCKPHGILLLRQYIYRSILHPVWLVIFTNTSRASVTSKKKTGRLRFLLMLIKHREAWHGRDRYALDQEKASWRSSYGYCPHLPHVMAFSNQCILSKKKKERKKERKKSKVCGEFTWWKKKHHTLFSFLLFLHLSPHSWVGSLWDGDDLNFVLSSTFYF